MTVVSDQRRNWGGLLSALVLLLLLALHIQQFGHGIRTTADDVAFLANYQQGWAAIFADAQRTAEFSGRFSHYIQTPLNSLGAYWAAEPTTRYAMLALYVAVWLMFAGYCARLLAQGQRSVALMICLWLVALHPLAYEHMPPNAYPLQNTVPILLILAARWWLLVKPQAGWLARLTAYALTAIGMWSGDFALIFASALLLAEHLRYLAVAYPGLTYRRMLGLSVPLSKLLWDVALVAVVMVPYVLYRQAFPSQYTGNSMTGFADPLRVLHTAWLHIYAGTSPYRFDATVLMQASTWVWVKTGVFATVAALLGAWCVALLPRWRARMIGATLLAAVLLSFYIVMPVALVARQQQWCFDYGVCGYLDSRIVYLLVGLVLAVLAIILRSWLSLRLAQLLVGLSIFIGAGSNYVINAHLASDMAHRSAPWQRAQQFACDGDYREQSDAQLIAQIDPAQLVPMHPHIYRAEFWQQHLNYLRQRSGCAIAPRNGSLVTLMRTMHFGSQGNGNLLLASGWSAPEPWGVWSIGQSSVMWLPLAGSAMEVSQLKLGFRLFSGPSLQQQVVKVAINDQPMGQWDFPNAGRGRDCCSLNLPLQGIDRFAGTLKITLSYDAVRDPSVAGESADGRALALGIHTLELLP